jgi:hypothetical protein
MDIAATTLTEEAARDLNRMLFMPNDATAGLFTHRALAHYIDGDLAAAEADLLAAEDRCARKPFPQGAFSLAYTRQIEVIIRIEAGQLERAAEVASGLATLGEQHGFDSWGLVGSAQHAFVQALIALRDTRTADDESRKAALQPHIATLTAFVEMWRALGVISLITFYDAILARLLIGGAEYEKARGRLQIALDLAGQTGMHFYDAELLRLRAQTTGDPELRQADLTAATTLARDQRARLFQLRCAIADFESGSGTAHKNLTQIVADFAIDSPWPELLRARTLLQ